MTFNWIKIPVNRILVVKISTTQCNIDKLIKKDKYCNSKVICFILRNQLVYD